MKALRYAGPLLVLGLTTVAAGQVVNVGDNYYHAATVGESWANGMSNVIQSQGQYNLTTSQAAINLEQARSDHLQNNLQAAQTYFAMRNLNTEQRFGDYAARKKVNEQNRLFQYGKEGRPKRPTSRELDPLTGQINWPFTLQAPEYKVSRDRIGKLFETRARQGGALGYEGHEAILAAIDALLLQLKSSINQLDSQEYVRSKNFVDRLAYEARHPVD